MKKKLASQRLSRTLEGNIFEAVALILTIVMWIPSCYMAIHDEVSVLLLPAFITVSAVYSMLWQAYRPEGIKYLIKKMTLEQMIIRSRMTRVMMVEVLILVDVILFFMKYNLQPDLPLSIGIGVTVITDLFFVVCLIRKNSRLK